MTPRRLDRRADPGRRRQGAVRHLSRDPRQGRSGTGLRRSTPPTPWNWRGCAIACWCSRAGASSASSPAPKSPRRASSRLSCARRSLRPATKASLETAAPGWFSAASWRQMFAGGSQQWWMPLLFLLLLIVAVGIYATVRTDVVPYTAQHPAYPACHCASGACHHRAVQCADGARLRCFGRRGHQPDRCDRLVSDR